MKKGDNLFVRIDYRVPGKEIDRVDLEEHMAYLKNVAVDRIFIGGGFLDVQGGMVILSASDMKDAEQITAGDPLVKKELVTSKIHEWKLGIVSEKI